MKPMIILILCLASSVIITKRSHQYRSIPSVPSNPHIGGVNSNFNSVLLKEGSVCYQSIPSFKGMEKKCESHLKCMYKNEQQARTMSGVPKYCLIPVLTSYEDSILNLAVNLLKKVTVRRGGVCYEFPGPEKICDDGLICSAKLPNGAISRSTKTCQPSGLPTIHQLHNTQNNDLNHNTHNTHNNLNGHNNHNNHHVANTYSQTSTRPITHINSINPNTHTINTVDQHSDYIDLSKGYVKECAWKVIEGGLCFSSTQNRKLEECVKGLKCLPRNGSKTEFSCQSHSSRSISLSNSLSSSLSSGLSRSRLSYSFSKSVFAKENQLCKVFKHPELTKTCERGFVCNRKVVKVSSGKKFKSKTEYTCQKATSKHSRVSKRISKAMNKSLKSSRGH